jgi:hypothetical protein
MANYQRAESGMGRRVHNGVSKNQNTGRVERAKKKSRKSSTFPQHLTFYVANGVANAVDVHEEHRHKL